MKVPEEKERARRRAGLGKRLRRLALALALLAALVILAVMVRLPERLVGHFLSKTLGASISISDLDFHSFRSVTAQNILVEGLPGGSLEGLKSASMDVVNVEGSLRRVLKGEVDQVQVAGARVVLLLPSPWLEEEEEEEESSFLIHALAVEGAQVLFETEDGATPSGPFDLSAEIRELGGERSGQAEIRAQSTSLDLLLRSVVDPAMLEGPEEVSGALGGGIRDLQATLRLGPASTLQADGTLGLFHLRRGEISGTQLDLEGLRFEWRQDSLGGNHGLLEANGATAQAPGGDKLGLTNLRATGSLYQDAGELHFLTEAATLRTGSLKTETLKTGASQRDEGRELILPPPSFIANGLRLGDGAWKVHLLPKFAFLERAEAQILWHPEEDLPRHVEGAVQGMRLEALSPWIPGLFVSKTGGWQADGLKVTGLANLEVNTLAKAAGSQGGTESAPLLHYRFSADIPSLLLPASLTAKIPGLQGPRELRGVVARARGELALEASQDGAPMEASLSIAGGNLPPGILPARGSFTGEVQGAPSLSLTGRLNADSARVGRLKARGTVALSNGSESTESSLDGSWTWSWKEARLASVTDLLRTLEAPIPRDLLLDGAVGASGSLRLSGTPSLEGSFHLKEGAAEGREPLTWGLADLESRGRFSWAADRLNISGLRLRGAAQVPPLDSAAFDLEGVMNANTENGTGELRSLTLDAGDLGTLSAAATASFDERLRGTVKITGSQLGALRNFLRPLTGELATGLAIQGSAEADLILTVEEGAWNLQGPARVQGSGFSSEDGSRVLEGFESQWKTQVEGSTSKEVPTRLQASAEVTGFQLLWGLFYGDFSGLQSTVSVDGTLEPLPEGEGVTFPPWHVDVAWTVPEGPSLGLRLDRNAATDEQADLRYALALRLEDLEGSYGRYLQGPLTDFSPRFARVRLAGDLGADLEGVFLVDGGTTMKGRFLAGGLLVEGIEGQLAMRDLDLDLPLDLAWNAEGKLRRELAGRQTPELQGPVFQDPVFQDPVLQGSVRFERVDLRGFRLPALQSTLKVQGDGISVQEAVSVPLAGGRIVLQDLNLINLLAPERFAETAVLIESLDLERLAKGLGLPPLEGRIDGRLPSLRLDATTLEVEGGGEVSLFGGTVRIGDISGENILSRFPKVTFSADLQGIDLGRATRRFDVGVMNGVLQGSVQDCELFRWVPVRCSGRFETVKVKGVRRNISVKAINNISILGTGQSLGFLDQGIRSFFNSYTYSRLGISMTLENDVFLLRGLEHRRDRELFLRGRLPFPIDVVNAQPGRTVSFQTMLRRLQTLDFSQATSSPTGGN